MAKQKKSGGRKLKLPSFIESLKDAMLEKMVGSLVIIIFLVLAFLLVQAFLHGSDYFRLKAVEARGFADKAQAVAVNTELLKAYKNKNLFEVDINAIGRYLSMRYPEAKSVSAKRTLPDKLTILVSFRRPIALVGESKFYPVDEDCVALFTVDAKTCGALPVISGIEARYDGRPVRKIDSKNLKTAIDLLKEIKSARFLENHRLTAVDASSLNEMAFYIDDGLEIRIGFENYKDRLFKLKETLKDTRLVRDKIKYIDLRFDGVTIGPK
jgi:cell division septal protein FtsQ